MTASRSPGRDPLRRLFRQTAERAGEGGAEGDAADDGERSEAFIVRMALDDTGRPVRTRVTHARTSAELVRPGWVPGEVGRFVEDCVGLWPSGPTRTADPRGGPREGPGAHEHVVDVDAGRILGGAPRDVDLRFAVVPSHPHHPRVHAELAARAYATAAPWTVLARRDADVDRTGHLAVRFTDLVLPRGVHRLRVRVRVRLEAPDSAAPEITLR